MHLKNLLIVPLVGLVAAVNAASVSTQKTCLTASGSKSVKPVPTVTSTHKKTNTLVSTKYNQKTVTVTPQAVTNTASKTTIVTISTTIDAKTSNVQVATTEYTTTTIFLATTTFTSTQTKSTTTTKTKTETVTVPTPSGFMPIQKTLEQATDDSSGSPLKRDTVPVPGFVLEGRQPGSGPLLAAVFGMEKRATTSSGKKSYPQKVRCDVTTFIPKTVTTTKTKSPTTITARTPITTITNTRTIQSTTTIVPSDVTITTTSTAISTIRKTITPSTTITTTTTTTATVMAPGPSVYAMCGKSNFGSSQNRRGGFTDFYLPWSSEQTTVTVQNPYQCCNICAKTEGCYMFYYSTKESCKIATSIGERDCSAKDICQGRVMYSETSPVLYTIGNGPYVQFDRYW